MALGWFALIYSFFLDFNHPIDFFSYFTIQSNLLIILWFTVAALTSNQFIRQPKIKSALAAYITVTMIIYFVLLFNANVQLSFVTSYILHLVMPASFILDWFLDRPKNKISLITALSWLIYPLVYCVYTLVRESIVGWYPYYFLSPAKMGSVENVGLAITGLIVFFTVVILTVYFLNNKLAKKA